MKNRHLGQLPPKPVAGLPPNFVHDKGRYRQQRAIAISKPDRASNKLVFAQAAREGTVTKRNLIPIAKGN
jgi:hypothetical protein